MRIVIFGASGATGRHLVDAAIRRGHDVTAFVRRPDRYEAPDGVRVVAGDVADRDPVALAVRDQDAVLVALGAATPIRRDRTISRGVRNIVDGMADAGVRRLVYLSYLGVPGGREQLSFLGRHAVAPYLARAVTADHTHNEEIIRTSGVDWTFVRPSLLSGGPATGRARHGEEIAARHLLTAVPRADVAEYMIGLLDDPASIRTAPAIMT